jgi:hypothetical protein
VKAVSEEICRERDTGIKDDEEDGVYSIEEDQYVEERPRGATWKKQCETTPWVVKKKS